VKSTLEFCSHRISTSGIAHGKFSWWVGVWVRKINGPKNKQIHGDKKDTPSANGFCLNDVACFFLWGRDMGVAAEITASPRRRSMFAIAAVIMLGLWGWSFVPPFQNWDNPNEDGFSHVPLFYTSIFCLPLGLFLLVGAIVGHGRYVRRARIALFVAAGMTIVVAAFLVVQRIANNNDGKVFGIQIGLQLDHQDGREISIAYLPLRQRVSL
jgi:hypothetical protein